MKNAAIDSSLVVAAVVAVIAQEELSMKSSSNRLGKSARLRKRQSVATIYKMLGPTYF